MNQKTFITVAGTIFCLVALGHLARAVFGWEIAINGWSAPLWISWVAFIITGFLSFTAFRLNR